MVSILRQLAGDKSLRTRLTGAAILVAVSISIIITSALISMKTITISDSGTAVACKTIGGTVEDVLSKAGISLREGDIVFPGLGYRLTSNLSVNILRAFPVNITANGQVIRVNTVGYTVEEVLSANGISLGENDVVNPAPDSVVTADMNISVVKVAKYMTTKSEEIPFKTISKPNSKLERGTVKVITEGKKGVKEVVYNMVVRDGVEVSKEVVGERIVTPAVDAVSEYGSRMTALVSRGTDLPREGEPAAYSRVITCNASAYTASTCGKSPSSKGYGITATGAKAKRGIIAVDPSVIPLGTRVYIESADGAYSYGYAVAADTGGAIKGNKVDLYMDSYSQCTQFGRRRVKVYILN